MRHAGIDQHVGQAGVAVPEDRAPLEFVDLDARSAFVPLFDDDDAVAHAIKHARQHDATLAITGNQDKRRL